MPPFVRRVPYRGPVRAVILDWAGTAVDYGCMGPAAVFVGVFETFGIRVTVAEARRFMGLMKQDHIRGMCALPAVIEQWQSKYGKPPGEAEVAALYTETEPMMVETIRRHADPIPGLDDFVAAMRYRGAKIGSCTGYTRPMLDVLVPEAAKNGDTPDASVCSSDVPAGRPYPWMCFRNAILLETYPLEALVKIGDTVADIEEGLNAGMWTIGLTQSGNALGLTRETAEALEPADLAARLAEVAARFKAAGAHFVAPGIWECLPLVEAIEVRLAEGRQPIDRRLQAS